jgi:hypothetical protein
MYHRMVVRRSISDAWKKVNDEDGKVKLQKIEAKILALSAANQRAFAKNYAEVVMHLTLYPHPTTAKSLIEGKS